MMILVGETTKQRRETLAALEVAAGAWDGNGRRFPGRGSPRTASWRRTIPPISTSPRSVPPQWSAKPGSWLPTIQVQSSAAVSSVSSSRALAGSRSQPKRSWKLSPRQIEARRAGALDLGRERGQRRMRIIGRKELPEPREPARLFEVQVGDEQRLLRGPEQRAVRRSRRTFRLRTKREPWASCNAGPNGQI